MKSSLCASGSGPTPETSIAEHSPNIELSTNLARVRGPQHPSRLETFALTGPQIKK